MSKNKNGRCRYLPSYVRRYSGEQSAISPERIDCDNSLSIALGDGAGATGPAQEFNHVCGRDSADLLVPPQEKPIDRVESKPVF